MAAPTVEMGLGGSIRALASSYFAGVEHFQMQAYPTPGFAFDYLARSYGQASPTGDVLGNKVYNVGPLRCYGTTPGVETVLPEISTAITTDGVDDYMQSGGSLTFWPDTGALSIEAIVKINASVAGAVEPHIWGNENFGLTYKSDGKVHAYYNGVDVLNTTAATGGTLHLVLTRSGSSPNDSVKLYVNGSSTTATPARATIYVSDMWAGRHRTNLHYLSATYYFLAVYGGELSAAQVSANYAAITWTDVTADTKGIVPLVIERGIRDDSPASRVASTGTLTFAMNNLANNSGGVTGYYSPGHASCRVGFTKGAPVRVKQGSDVIFAGRIRTIAPTPGKTGGVLSTVLATDYMDVAATTLLEGLPILENVTGDQVLLSIVGILPQQPNGVMSFPGSEAYTLALDNTRDEAVSLLQEMHRLALSELGYIYVLRDGRLVYEARGTRVLNEPAATVTLSNTMHGLEVAEVSSQSLNRVQITVHPREIDTAATTVLFALTNPLQIGPGEVKTIIGPYRTASSPGITTRVGGLEMVTPVSTTDYVMNVLNDGTGADLTASLGIVANYGANGVQFVLTNNAAEAAFITKLQCRGKGVYDFRTVVVRSQNDAGVAADGVNPLNIDMVYQEDPNVGQALADSLLAGYGDLSGTRARRVDLLPDDPALPSNLHQKDISDRIALSETVTGATGEYYINGVRLEYKAGALARLSWWLTPAEPVSYWTLGLAGASELDDTTLLGAA